MGQPTQRATNYTARSNIDTAQIVLHANGQRPNRAMIRQRSRRRQRRGKPHTEHGLGVLLARKNQLEETTTCERELTEAVRGKFDKLGWLNRLVETSTREREIDRSCVLKRGRGPRRFDRLEMAEPPGRTGHV